MVFWSKEVRPLKNNPRAFCTYFFFDTSPNLLTYLKISNNIVSERFIRQVFEETTVAIPTTA